MLTIEGLNQYYGESHILAGSGTGGAGRRGDQPDGPQRRGQDHFAEVPDGLLPIRSGTITFAGEDLSRLPAERRAPLGIGYVPQGRQIFPLLTVEENLKIGLGPIPAFTTGAGIDLRTVPGARP